MSPSKVCCCARSTGKEPLNEAHTLRAGVHRFLEVCLFLIAIGPPAIGYTAGLGRLTVNSALGQPFKAEIDLVAVGKDEKDSLEVCLASQDTFRRVNIDYSPILSTFSTSIETHPDGQPYVRIISPQPVAEPFVNMLVELKWSSGRLLREYTVLPPAAGNDAHPQARPVTQAVAVSGKAEPATGKSGVSITQDERPVWDGSASLDGTLSVYGPVKQGDTLSKIATNIVFPAGVSFNQMMIALHRANRNAFFGNNINQLKTGPILRIPDNSEIRVITAAEANQEVKMQTADWKQRRFGDMEGVSEELKQTGTGKIGSAVEVDIISVQEPPPGGSGAYKKARNGRM